MAQIQSLAQELPHAMAAAKKKKKKKKKESPEFQEKNYAQNKPFGLQEGSDFSSEM